MTFPTIAATNNGNSGATSVTHVVNLPASIASGDLLLVFFSNTQAANNAPSITTPASGWTPMFTANQGAFENLTVWYRVADGSEGSSITVTIGNGNARSAAWVCYRITGYTGTPENGTASAAATSSPDPPSVSPSWGSDDNLFIACYGWRGNVAHSSYPTNYSLSQLTDRWVNSSGCGIAVAGRNVTASSGDPGAAGIAATTNTVANTIVVRGVTGGGTGSSWYYNALCGGAA